MDSYLASYAIRREEDDHVLEIGCIKVCCAPDDIPAAAVKAVLDEQKRRLPRDHYVAIMSWAPDPETRPC